MAYATIEDVRAAFGLEDATGATDAALTGAIEAVHPRVAASLAPDMVEGETPADVRRGEALLAGAWLFMAMAARDAMDRKRVSVGPGRVTESERFESLLAIAALAERRAWDLLSPFLAPGQDSQSLMLTGTEAVLGEG